MQLIKKHKKMLILFVLLVLITMSIFYFKQNENSPSDENADVNPRINQQNRVKTFDNVPESEEIQINGVTMKNFMKESPHNSELNLFILAQSNNHEIQYMNSFNHFLIIINSTPFQQKKVLAENEFLRLLDIDKQEACKLNVTISTPKHVSPEETGKQHRLSFC